MLSERANRLWPSTDIPDDMATFGEVLGGFGGLIGFWGFDRFLGVSKEILGCFLGVFEWFFGGF